VVEAAQANVGAVVMGRNMFGGGPGPWTQDPPWDGWWGDNPFRAPIFVLTHYPRVPLEMEGGRFTFVTEGIGSALEQAERAADGRDVLVGGRANVVQQCLAAGLVDAFELHVVPVLLGDGELLFENVGDLHVEQVRAIQAPGVTHISYRVVR
jgi:dihydrofolate reductase